MRPNRISLQTRIDRVSRGYYADPEYNLSMIAAMADLPLVDYLGGYDRERRELYFILGITEEEQETIPYKEIAWRIVYFRQELHDSALAQRSAYLLSAPLRKYYERWREQHEKTSA